MELIQNLDLSGSVESIKAQRESIRAVQDALAGILAKAKEKNEAMDIRMVKPKAFARLVEVSGVVLNGAEQAAMKKMEEGLKKLKFFNLPEEYWNPVIDKAERIAASQAKERQELKAQVELGRIRGQVEAERPSESAEINLDYYSTRNRAYSTIQELLVSKTIKPEEVGGLMSQSGWKALEGRVSGATLETVQQISSLDSNGFDRLGMATIVTASLDQWARDEKLNEAKEGDSLWDKVSAKTKKFYQEHTGFCQFALVAAGAFVGYKLIKYLWGRKKKNVPKENGEGGWFPSPLGIGALAVAGVGVYLGRNRIAAWFKEKFGGLIGQAEAVKKGQKILEAVQKGDYAAAFEIWQELPDTNPELHQKSSEMFKGLGVGVPIDVLKNAGPMTYEAYMKQQDSLFAFLDGRAKEFTGESWLVSLYKARTDLSSGGKRLFNAFKALEETTDASGKPILDKNEAKNKTVDEVLTLLLKKDLVSIKEPIIAKMNGVPFESKNEGGEVEAGYLAMAAEETKETYNGLFSDIAHESLEQLPPKVKEVIKKYKTENESNEWDKKNLLEKGAWVGQYVWDVVKAVKEENGSNLMVSAAGIFLWVGPKETGKWTLIGSNKAVISAFWELATLDPMGAFEHYMAGATPFMIAGAGIGLITKGPSGAIKGAWTGAKLPWTVVKKEAEIITKIGFYGRPDVIRRYASLGLYSAKTEMAYRAKWLTHWSRAAKERRLAVYQADRLIALREELALAKERLMTPGLGKGAAKELQKKLEGEIGRLKGRLDTLGGEKILRARRALRLEQIFGENADKTIGMILKDPALEKLFLEEGSRDVVKGLLQTNRPEFYVKLLQGEGGKGLLEIIERKDLLKNRKFLEVMGDFDTLFSPTGEVDQKVLAEIVKRAEQLDLPLYEKMLAKVQGVIRVPFKFATVKNISAKWQSSAEWVSQRKAIQACVRSFDKYLKAPVSSALARFNEWRGPKFGQAELEELVKERNPTKIKNFLKSKGLKNVERWSGELISETSSVDDVKYLIEETAKLEGKIVKFAPEVSRLTPSTRFIKYAKYAKLVPKGAVGALAFVPAAFDFYGAATTENKEMAGKLVEKGIGNSVAASVEVGILYGVGAAAGTAASAALLAPTYMWNTGYESAMEQAKQAGEWAAEYDHETLVHQWLSTGIGTAGEAYHRFFTTADEKTYEEAFKKTRKEILSAIFLSEGERFPKENEYRMIYFERENDFASPGFDYAKALETLHDSRLFAEAMAAREKGLDRVGKLELANARFSPEAINTSDIIGVTVAYKREAARLTHPALAGKFEKMSTGSLMDLYGELDKAFANPDNVAEFSNNEKMVRQELKNYLFYNRHIEADAALGARYLKAVDEKVVARLGKLPENGEELKKARQEAMEEIKKDVDVRSALAKLELLQNEEEEIPEEGIEDNAGCYAICKLAQYLGYEGSQTEAGLRGFFAENRADAFGLYWKDGTWRGNESWWKDKEIGGSINENMVRSLIAHFRNNPKDVLEHRGESIALFGEGEEFENQVLKRADILEKALGEYPNRKAKAPEGLVA